MSAKYYMGVCLLGIGLFLHNSLFSQLFWNSYKTPQKFQIESIFQDSKGYIWIGKQGSINRFDGISWDSYKLADSLSSAVVCFTERDNGELWLGLHNGDIYFQKENQWRRFEPEEGTPQKPITALMFDQEDRLWISTYGEGLYYYSKERMYNLDAAEGLPSNEIYTAVLGPESRVWCATDRGLGIVWLENGTKKVVSLGKEKGLSDEICTSLSLSPKGEILVGMFDGSIAQVSSPDKQIKQHLNCSEKPIKQVIDDGKNRWILDEDGSLWRQEGTSLSLSQTPGSVKYLFSGQRGMLWIVDEKNNMYSAATYISNESKPPRTPQAMTYDDLGILWVGSDSGLYTYQSDRKLWESIPLSKHLNISSLYADHLGRIWLGTLGQGLWLFYPSSTTFSPISLQGNTSKVPILSISGNQRSIWVATFGGVHLCNLSDKGQIISKRHFQEADGLGINYIYQTRTDEQGNTWLATDGRGIGFWKNKELHLDPSLNGTSIFSISQDSNGAIWMLGDKGEVIYKTPTSNDTLLHFQDREGLAIYAISTQRAVLIYEKELYVINRENGQMIPILTEKQFEGFGSELNVIVEGKKGELWIGSRYGILKLDLERIPVDLGPKASIKDLIVNLKDRGTFNNSFEHDENHLTFEYAGLWYQEPGRLIFKHKLKGHDLNWIASRNHQAVYADLSPGEYTFYLQVGIDGFHTPDESIEYTFKIKEPFWLNPFFIITGLSFVVLSLIGIVRYRESQIKYSQALLRQNIEHQFETLQSQINPHFLFNAFSTLSGIIEESPKKATIYVERLSDLFRNTLTYRNQSLISLEEELNILDNYYHLQKERYGPNFILEVSVHPSALDKKIPPLALQILVENTLRHNIASREQPLGVKIYSEDDTVIVQNQLQLRSSVAESTKLGIENIRERYQLLSEEEIEILMDEQYYTVILPLLT